MPTGLGSAAPTSVQLLSSTAQRHVENLKFYFLFLQRAAEFRSIFRIFKMRTSSYVIPPLLNIS